MKTALKIITVTVLVILIVVMSLVSIIINRGPLSALYNRHIAAHAGNQEEYDFINIEEMTDSPLKGRNIAILGSSVAFGADSNQQAVGEYLSRRFGTGLAKETVSSTTLVDKMPWSYVRRIRKLDAGAKYSLFVCQLSTNDATLKSELGEIRDNATLDELDTKTVTGALEYIIQYARATWNCPVVFFTNTRYDDENYGKMVDRLLQLKEKYDICVIDLWNSNINDQVGDDDLKLYMYDKIHPTRAGYSVWWGPEMEKQLLEYLNKGGY